MNLIFIIFKGPLLFLKKLLKNPLLVVLYTFVTKWYIIMTLSGMIVVYYVFIGLVQTGIIKKSEDILFHSIDIAKSVSQNCIPKLAGSIHEFWNCVTNPPRYEPKAPGEDEINKIIENTIRGKNPLLESSSNITNEDPYE